MLTCCTALTRVEYQISLQTRPDQAYNLGVGMDGKN